MIEWGSEPDLFGPRHEFRVGLMARAMGRMLPRGCVLDAGCGVGSLSTSLRKRGYRVYGIDVSQGFCRHVAGDFRRESRFPEAAVIRGEISRLPFQDGGFDGVVCGDVLEHVDDDEASLLEFRRVLRHGGVLIVTVPLRGELWDQADVWAGHKRRYERENLCRILDLSGFEVEAVKPYGFPFGWFYHRLVTRSIVARSASEPTSGDRFRLFKQIGRQRSLVYCLARLFDLDRLLPIKRWASGAMIVGRKRP